MNDSSSSPLQKTSEELIAIALNSHDMASQYYLLVSWLAYII